MSLKPWSVKKIRSELRQVISEIEKFEWDDPFVDPPNSYYDTMKRLQLKRERLSSLLDRHLDRIENE